MRARVVIGFAIWCWMLWSAGVWAQTPNLKLGPQAVYVIPLNSVTNPVEPYSLAELQTMFTGPQWQQIWYEFSYGGRFGPFTATVAPYQTLNDSASPVNYNSCTGKNALMSFGLDRLKALYGTNVYFYSRTYFALPGFACNVVGGGGGVWTRLERRFPIWEAVHETGHSLGIMAEARGQHCVQNVCTVRDYEHPYTDMGYADGKGHFTYNEKALAGWVGLPGMPLAFTVTQSGDYAMEPYERPLTPSGIIALKVGGLTLEARIDGSKYGNNPGVIVNEGNTLRDLDLIGGDDYTLSLGQSFFDPASGATITTVGFGPTGAVVRVAFPGAPSPCGEPSCKPGKPSRPILQ